METIDFNGVFVNKKPYDEYMKIINTSITEKRVKSNEQYYEKHHILPKSCGGKNNKDNLVLLTAKEHFIAHKLLVEMYPEKSNEWFKMSTAINFFLGQDNKTHFSPEEYEKTRLNHVEAIKNWANRPETKANTSKVHKGRKKSPEEIQHITESQNRPETKLAKSNSLKGKKRTKEQCQNYKKAQNRPDLIKLKRSRRGAKNHNSKPVEQYSLTGDLIETFCCISDAIKSTKIENISFVCNNKRKSAGGFIWKFATQPPHNT
jgi:hypothetical protein